MDGIIGIVVLLVVLIGVGNGIRLLFSGAKVAAAGAKSAITGESFNLDEALGRISAMETRISKKNSESDGSGLNYYSVEVKGLFPIFDSCEVTFTVSIIDITEGNENPKPVFSILEQFQESSTLAFL